MVESVKKKKEHDFLVAIVDDHIDIVISISNYLESNGFRTIGAYSGEDAIKLCKKNAPDALILEIRMPDMNGFKVADSLPRTQKIIFISGFDDAEGKMKNYSNCIGIARKPVDLDYVASLLRAEFGLEKKDF